ncbi:spore germination protein [Paenibacillus athensensis]|nr:spore germination protein [Paenibacillus athensensis]MCD1259263.1 spore germination protein [Paenibacillus athensensis]
MDNTREVAEFLNIKFSGYSGFVWQELEAPQAHARIGYLQGMCSGQKLHELILSPFSKMESPDQFTAYLQALPFLKPYQTLTQTMESVARGYAVLLYDGRVLLLDLRTELNNSISEANVENVVQGPKNGLSEDLNTNLFLVRSRYPQPSLQIESLTAGTVSQTPIAIVYDANLADPQVLDALRRTLKEIKAPMIQAANQLELHLNRKNRSLLPTMMVTERPDRIAFNLSQGKIIVVLHGTPFALIVPVVFYDFFTSMEDLTQAYWVGRFLLTVRYIGLAINLTLASVYVAIASYNPDFLRVQLTLSIAGSRASVPYPSYIEVLFMLVMMELLTEASIRLPKSIGSTATTVGGLILGQAATQAGLVSNIMIIIVAAVAISNFVVPLAAMGFSLRVLKYILLIITTLSGLTGLIIGTAALLSYLATLESFGQKYFRLYMAKPASSPRSG